MAVKYLVTPTKMTLSASAEHDMLREVERIQTIEALEADAGLSMVKVPHPYFHHQNSEIQCYAMELIHGFDLSHDLRGMREGEEKEHLLKKLSVIDERELEGEIRTFYARMHEYCLHGDMKPANMMLNQDGMFYIIDLGQSRLVTDITDKEREQLYVLQDDEIKMSIECTRRIVKEAKQILAER
jgi:serine/threonine protein kinase